MTQAPASACAPDLAPDSYVLLGLATCYWRQEGETVAVAVVEPVPSAYLETLLQGISTAYRQIWGTTLAQALALDPALVEASEMPSPAQRCADFEERVFAAARTYQNRPATAQLVPVGTVRTDLNYSTEKPRILNPKNKVSRSENVKQHKYTHEML
ncbi:MAG: hypothetical protein HC929_10440 [Leptolyngbyaceae cyanobacterium SM2_5_2]|nr:hypothetical protein [Leptolyngbyaceae cyanobacterium SM2_5_2]